MRRLRLVLALALMVPIATVFAPEAVSQERQARAGVASVDASWHIGASGGQFSATEPPFSAEAIDPHMHSTKKRPSKGLGSQVTVRALVVEGANGEKVAIVSHDLYLPQDLLTRRIAAQVESSTGIPAENVMVTASHNHNSPYYSTPGWGTWIFQDVYDLRFFNYMAERATEAVQKANEGLVPVRMGGETTEFNEITSHTYGPKLGDDGLPAGQPYDHTTGELTVVSFDDISDPQQPEPLATWIVFGVHPEWTWGYDLINGDISAATMRIVDREVGGTTVWSGREIGTSGPHKDTRAHEPEERREYQDNGFAEVDRAARLLADAVEATRTEVQNDAASNPSRYAPLSSDFEVAAISQRFAPPSTRPYPGVSNCNTAAWFHGDPRVPILGLPDCREGDMPAQVGEAYGEIGGQIYDGLKEAGVPIPDSISPTKLTGVEETAAVHLMAIKLGDIGITVCPCEMFTDTALNIESRIDKTPDNMWLGWNWADQETPSGRDWCVQNADTTWTCADPRNPSSDLEPVSDLAYRRMNAQIENDAAGWEIDDLQDPEADLMTLGAESEPTDPAAIKGNFTHEELTDFGFKLPIAVGMGNDYWGYVPEYREYRAHEHYRKALSGVGPHGADFLATRLTRLAASLNGGPAIALRPIDLAYQAESVRAEGVAQGLGAAGAAYEAAYQASLPADAGTPGVISQPQVVERFDAAHLRWVGGSTYADMPSVVVQRRSNGEWIPYANTDGDIQLTVKMPSFEEMQAWRAGEFQWEWTAAFETFGSDVVLPDLSGVARDRTPTGTYRFVVEGQRRTGPPATLEDYRIESEPFEVRPWDGLTVDDLRIEPDKTLSFKVGPTSTHTYDGGKVEVLAPVDLPDTYDSPFEIIDGARRVFTYGLADPTRHQVYCSFCTFRPWADTAEVTSATVTIQGPTGKRTRVPATYDSATGRWRTAAAVPGRGSAWVAAGDVIDEFQSTNGVPSATVRR